MSGRVRVREIEAADRDSVGTFLHAHLNPRVTASQWAAYITAPWAVDAPCGFLLEAAGALGAVGAAGALGAVEADKADGGIVGVQLVFRSERALAGRTVTVCNLGALCVLPDYRTHALRLIRAALGGSEDVFTDLSPSGGVVGLNERMGFVHLDTSTALVPAFPWPRTFSARGARARVVSDPEAIAARLSARDLRILNEHKGAAAAHHVLLERSGRQCYVVYRRDRRKGLPLFATVLHTSDPEALRAMFPALTRYLLLRHGVAATLAERRVVGAAPRLSRRLPSARPRMVRSRSVPPDAVDYLYSELTCVAW